jgi:hypothetical protein
MRNYAMVPKPEFPYPSTEQNVAVSIDVCTQMFRVDYVLKTLFDELPKDKGDLSRRIREVKAAVNLLDVMRTRMPSYAEDRYVEAGEKAKPAVRASAPSHHAAHILLRNYYMTPKPECKHPATLHNIGIFIDLATRIFQVHHALDLAVRSLPMSGSGQYHIGDLQDALYMLSVVRKRLPYYEDDLQVDPEQRDHLEDFIRTQSVV